jgi:hypothetical protein
MAAALIRNDWTAWQALLNLGMLEAETERA